MKQAKRILTDAHGDEVLHLHRDVLDADLTAAEKVMMAALRKQAFLTGRITLHYPGIAGLARMPLSTVKNRGGVIDRLRCKGWIRGAVKDGAGIEVRMSPCWRSKSGAESDYDACAGTGPAPDPEKGGTETVPDSTEPVPGAVPNRYRASTESVPPSDNKERVKGIENKNKSKAPVALTGSGPPKPGASLENSEEERGTPKAAPSLPPDLAAALRAEAEAWTEQVAEYIGGDRGVAWGKEVRLRRPNGQAPLVVKKVEPVGSKPWDEDVREVYAFAAARHPDADPVLAFRAVIREPARYRAQRQHILGHALRMQASMGYDRPRIKLCSLTRLDNTGRNVPRSVHSIGKQDVCAGSLLRRAQDVADPVPAPCACAPNPQIDAEFRRRADCKGLYGAPCWEGCWRDANARFVAAGMSMSDYFAYINDIFKAENCGKDSPVPWVLDSVDPQLLRAIHEEHMECGMDFCGNWGGGAAEPAGTEAEAQDRRVGADTARPQPVPVPAPEPRVPVPDDAAVSRCPSTSNDRKEA